MNSTTKSLPRRGLVAACAAIGAIAAALSIGAATASAETEAFAKPAMTMCASPTSTGFDVLSRVENTSDNDIIHQRKIETHVGNDVWEMRVVEERVIEPGNISLMVQDVKDQANGGSDSLTFGSYAIDAETGDQSLFVYRNYHLPHVMGLC
jgi:hypothetical protein